MADITKPIDQQLWANLGYIRSLKDRQFVIDVLEARRDFLRLRRREEVAIRAVYVAAADQVAKDLRRLKPTIGQLTRNHLVALEKSLRREIQVIDEVVKRQTRESITDAVKLSARPIDNQLLRAIREADVGLDVVKLQRGFADVNTAAVEALWQRTHKGLRVSDRIWNNSQHARQAMRDLVQVGVAAGRDTVQIARDLEQYVRKGVGTLAEDYPAMMRRMNKRIPRDLSFEALRLVRTEKAKAYTEGTYSRGRTSPSYKGSKWMLSDAHPVVDICDTLATQDLYRLGPGVYPRGEEPVVPHPNCLCSVVPVLADTADFVNDLIAWKNTPSSKPYLEEWYRTVYVPMRAA